MQDFKRLLKPKNSTYAQTDLDSYVELSSGKIRGALKFKKPYLYAPIFNLIADKDSAVGAGISKRIADITNKFFTHELGENEDENIKAIIRASIDARLFGYGMLNLYVDENAKFGACYIERKFIYAKEEGFYLVSKNGREFRADEPNFVIFTHEPNLLKLIWIVYAKHYVLANYLKFTEFLGVPPLIANASSSDTQIIDDLAEAIKEIHSGSYAAIGPDDKISILQGSGNIADFLDFIRYADDEIAKVINGAALTSNAQNSGSYAMSKTHENTAMQILAADVSYAVKCVNEIYALLGKTPNLNIQIEKDVDLLARAQTLQILNAMGYEIAPEQIAREFDLPLPNSRGLKPNLDKNSAFNERNLPLTRIDKAVDSLDFKEANSDIKNYVTGVLNACETYEDALKILQKNSGGFKLETLENELINLIANAEISGNF